MPALEEASLTEPYWGRAMPHGCRTKLTMLPPPLEGACATPDSLRSVMAGLRVVTARALAGEARIAFDRGDAALFEGALGALVELVSTASRGRS
jgi:hypothetical protein